MSSRDRRRFSTARWPAHAWLFLVLVPFIAAACVTVSDQEGGSTTPTPDPDATVLSPFATPTLAALVTPAPTPTPVPTPVPVEAEVFGFLPNWLLEDAALALETDLLTTVAFHGVEASGDGRLVSKKPSGDVPPGWRVLGSEAFTQLKTELQEDEVDVVLTVQRFGWTPATLKRTESLLTDKKDRTRLAERIAKFVTDRGFDGVNLDFEPMPAKLSGQYAAFVREVRAALDEVDSDLQLSVDIVPGSPGYDLAALTADDAADTAILMGYNLRGGGAGTTGSMSPLSDPSGVDLETTLADALAQVSPEKLILALPWYGRSWSTESDAAGSATVSGKGIDVSADPPYAVAVELASQSGRQYDADQASAWTAYPKRQCATCPVVWRQLWYDDPDSFGSKVDHAVELGLGGVGIWALGHEAGRTELWETLRHRLRRGVDDTAPNGSASVDPNQILGEFEDLDVVEGSAPLQLFASDGPGGSGLALVRIGLDAEQDADGRLITARDYPAVERIDFPLGDPETGGDAESGPRSIYVQWRDVAGNWSMPVMLEVRVEQPVGMPTTDDLE